MMSRTTGRERRKARIRKKLSGSKEKPRLSVFKSARHIGAQLIDDGAGTTLVSAATYAADFRGNKDNQNCKGAKAVGELLAAKAAAKGISDVVFDRNGYKYHGRVKALADGARQKGLKF
jgi:large subunit ribosomal protein L18